MKKNLHFAIVMLALTSILPESFATTNLMSTAPKTLVLPKKQVVLPSSQVIAITVLPSTQVAIDPIISTTQNVVPPTQPVNPPLPQAPTNPPPVISTVSTTRVLLWSGSRVPSIPMTTISTTDKIDFDFRTGSDNLESKDCQRNPDLYVYIRGKDPIHLPNMNNGQTWPNNSIRRVSIPLDGTVKIEDIESIKISRNSPSRDNVCGIIADNWNLDKLTVTASIKINGRTQRSVLANIVPPAQGQPVFRFVYETRGNTNPNIGTSWTWVFTQSRTPSSPINSSTTSTSARISATIITGGDDLRGGNDNVSLTLKFNNSTRSVIINNINDGAGWANWSEKTVSKEIRNSAALNINDIKSVEVRHTGGGWVGADNWHVDKILINISKDGMSRLLVDKVGAPIHMFTGDTRRKIFVVGE
jgi:hypothetical protein